MAVSYLKSKRARKQDDANKYLTNRKLKRFNWGKGLDILFKTKQKHEVAVSQLCIKCVSAHPLSKSTFRVIAMKEKTSLSK